MLRASASAHETKKNALPVECKSQRNVFNKSASYCWYWLKEKLFQIYIQIKNSPDLSTYKESRGETRALFGGGGGGIFIYSYFAGRISFEISCF